MSPLAALLALPILATGYVSYGDTRTASGTVPTVGVTAACPPQLAFGTVVWLDGVGERRCEDSYSTQLGPRVDCYVGSVAEAYRLTGERAWMVVERG